MLGNNIVLSPCPKGRRIEGVAYAANMYPGILVSLVSGSTPDGGNRLQWQPWSYTTGESCLLAVLDYDGDQGFTYSTAYQVGKRCFIYFPQPGDELNLLLAHVSGSPTGDPAFTVGEARSAQAVT